MVIFFTIQLDQNYTHANLHLTLNLPNHMDLYYTILIDIA